MDLKEKATFRIMLAQAEHTGFLKGLKAGLDFYNEIYKLQNLKKAEEDQKAKQ